MGLMLLIIYGEYIVTLQVDGCTEEWDGELGQFYEEDLHNIPFALQRLVGFTELQNYDTFGMDCGKSINNCIDDDSRAFPLLETTTNKMHDEISMNMINDVHKLPMDLFRNKLIEHFDMLFQQNKIQWPRCSSDN